MKANYNGTDIEVSITNADVLEAIESTKEKVSAFKNFKTIPELVKGIRDIGASVKVIVEESGEDFNALFPKADALDYMKFIKAVTESFNAADFSNEMKQLLSGWKHLVAQAMKEELPVPAFSSALNYFYSLVSAKLPANMIQAQRDYFGAHTFERTDELRGQFFHENWTGHGGDTKSGTYNV